MRNFPKQAKQALRVYLERGERALQMATAGDYESLDDALRWRTAAFHNFRVADALATQAGEDITTDPEMRALEVKIRDVDNRLGSLLAELAKQADVQVRKLGLARQSLRRYQSGRPGQSTFTHSV